MPQVDTPHARDQPRDLTIVPSPEEKKAKMTDLGENSSQQQHNPRGGYDDSKKRSWRTDGDVAGDQGFNKHQRGPGMFGIKILIPNPLVGAVIGRGGEEMKKLKDDTSCFVKISQNNKYFPNTTDRPCYVEGEAANVNRALRVIQDKITNDNAKRGPSVDDQRKKCCKIIIGSNAAGKTIGKGGENVIRLKESFNVFVKVMSRDEIIQGLDERTVTVSSNTANLDNIMDATCDIVDMAANMTNGGTDKNLDYDFYGGGGGDGAPPPSTGGGRGGGFNSSFGNKSFGGGNNNSYGGGNNYSRGGQNNSRGGRGGGGYNNNNNNTGSSGYPSSNSYTNAANNSSIPIQQYGASATRGNTSGGGYGNNVGGGGSYDSTSGGNQGNQQSGYQSGGQSGYQAGGGNQQPSGYQGGNQGYQGGNQSSGYQSGGTSGYQGNRGGGYQGNNTSSGYQGNNASSGYQGGNNSSGGYQGNSSSGYQGGRGGGGRGGGGYNNSRGGGMRGGRGGNTRGGRGGNASS